MFPWRWSSRRRRPLERRKLPPRDQECSADYSRRFAGRPPGNLWLPAEHFPEPRRPGPERDSFSAALVQAGWTRSSIPSKLTSTYPGVHRVYYRDDALPSGLPTLAEVFRANGYFNYAFHNNDMVDATFGFPRGFDIFRKSDDEGIAVLAGLALDGALPKGSSFNPEEAGQLARFLRAAGSAPPRHPLSVRGPGRDQRTAGPACHRGGDRRPALPDGRIERRQ